MADKTRKPEPKAIAPATIVGRPNGVNLTWADNVLMEANFELQASRVHEVASGRIQGEIAIIRRNGTSVMSLLTPQWFDFTSASYKSDLERVMRYRIAEVDWVSVIDQTCFHVINNCRAGEPEIRTNTKSIKTTQPQFLLFPFLARNQANILFGKKGSAKSTLALLFALAVASEWKDCPYFDVREFGSVLWLDWETDQEGFEYDLGRLHEGCGQHTDNIYYRHCRGSLSGQVERIKELREKYSAQLTVIDSIAPASGGEIKEAGIAIAYHDALRYIGGTTLSIGHPTKADQGSVTGAGQYEDLARNVWEAVYDQAEDSSSANQALLHRKNYKTGYLPARGYHYEFCDNAIIITTQDAHLVAGAVQKMSLRIQILDLLKSGSRSHKSLTDDTGVKGPTLSSRLNELKRAGEIMRLPNGQWARVHYQTNN